jgi:hypothetical protein
MEIYLDESGNLGRLGARASKADPYFVIAALIVRDDLPIKRCIKDIRRRKIKKKYRVRSELKFSNSDDTIRRRILECVGRTNNDIAFALLRKYQVDEGLRDKPQVVYNYLCKQLLYRIIAKYELDGTINIIVDRSLYGVQRENFDDYVEGRIGFRIPASIEVSHVDSKQCPCVQAIDFVAGAISRKYRDNDDLYYQKIQNRVCIALDFFEPYKRKL